MMNAIGPVAAPGVMSTPGVARAAGPGASFGDLLQASIDRINGLQAEADFALHRVKEGVAGPGEFLVATRKAQMALESLLQIRDKLTGALEEIQRMRV